MASARSTRAWRRPPPHGWSIQPVVANKWRLCLTTAAETRIKKVLKDLKARGLRFRDEVTGHWLDPDPDPPADPEKTAYASDVPPYWGLAEVLAAAGIGGTATRAAFSVGALQTSTWEIVGEGA